MTLPDRTTFESAYSGQAPWDIGRPQKALLDVADRITGSVLDAGCGTGMDGIDRMPAHDMASARFPHVGGVATRKTTSRRSP